MAVYNIEIGNNAPNHHSVEDIERVIKQAFPHSVVKVTLRHKGSMKEVNDEELYNLYMAAG